MLHPERNHSMLFNHVQFSPEVKKVLPDDSFWFTIIREPLSYFESAYGYFKADRLTGVDFVTFMMNHEKYMSKLQTAGFVLYGLQIDLGFNRSTDVDTVIKYMEDNFDLVIVTTYFDEGLCYLQKQLCWNVDDIVYLNQNQRSNKTIITPEQEAKFQSIVQRVIPVYAKVYHHFEKKFKEMPKTFDMDQGVKRLKEHIKLKKENCLKEDHATISDDEILIPGYQPVPISSYKLKNHSTDCLLLAMPGPSMRDCLKNRENGGSCP